MKKRKARVIKVTDDIDDMIRHTVSNVRDGMGIQESCEEFIRLAMWLLEEAERDSDYSISCSVHTSCANCLMDLDECEEANKCGRDLFTANTEEWE